MFKAKFTFTFTFMHLADAFIQSDLQCIQAIIFIFIFYQYVNTKYYKTDYRFENEI